MKTKGILFSGSEENVELAKKHIMQHGIVYWCLPVPIKYEEERFPIIALLHVKGKGICYKCSISDIIPFHPLHFKDPKKKPVAWVEGQRTERRKYKATLSISKMRPFYYNTIKLKKRDGGVIGNAPQGYSKIMIPR